MRIIDHPISTALGLCTVGLLFLIAPFVSPSHVFIYHLSVPATAMFSSVGIDFCLAWMAVTAVFLLARKIAWLNAAVWVAIVALLPWLAAKNVIMLELWPFPRWFSVLLVAIPLVLLAGLSFLRRPVARRVFGSIRKFMTVALGLLAFPGLLLLLQLPWFAWQARNLNPVFHASRTAPVATPGEHARIVWILLDELSYQQIFEQRLSGLSLPAFDRLAEQSTVFTHVIPAGFFTEVVVPSLITGSPVEDLQITADGRLRSVWNPASSAWTRFDAKQTVFQDARSAGYGTGIAGWYNPYCRIMPAVLDSCYWTFRSGTIAYIPASQSSAQTVPSPFYLFGFFAGWLRLPHSTPPTEIFSQRQIDDYQDLLRAGDALLADTAFNFAFLHLPVPHPHGFYDRKRMQFTTRGGSYIDNLVLADRYLAHVREELERQGQWDSSMVVVMGDHSWRTKIWKILPQWSSEEQAASHGGHFDDRPAYLVKMPQQKEAVRVDRPFPAIRTRALFDAVMEKRVNTGQDLAEWAGQ